jgi:molybdopterin/thiamine biosynthesis adenylyltransferase
MNAEFLEITLPAGADSIPLVDVAARLPRFVGGPPDASARLAGLRALIVGAGSIGFEYVQQIARWQAEQIGIVDPKKFKSESLMTHGAPPEAIGHSKAMYAARLAKRISPRSRVFALPAEFSSVPLSRLAEFNLVLLATDNLLAELRVSQACFPLGLPVIQGSVHGDTLSGHVRIYGHGSPAAPCVACGFTRAEWDYLNHNSLFSCEGFVSPATKSEVALQPTMSVHALCSFIAQLSLLYSMRDHLSLGKSVRDTVTEFCAYTGQIVTTELTRREQCPCPHSRYRRATPPRPLRECTLRELAQAAAKDSDEAADASFELDDWFYAEQATCPCGHQQRVQRFVNARMRHVGHCQKCQRPLPRNLFYTHRAAPGTLLEPLIDTPLRQLSGAEARWAIVRGATNATLFLHATETPKTL